MEFLTRTRRAESRAVEDEVEVEAEAEGGEDVMMQSRSWVIRDMTASAKVSVLSWRWCASRRRRARVDERHWLTGSVEAEKSPFGVSWAFPQSIYVEEERSKNKRQKKRERQTA